LDILKWAREHGCPWYRDTCINAAEYGHLDVCEFLVNAGANIELCSSGEEFSPLQFACKAGHLLVCEFLVKVGAKVNNDDNFNPTSLELASYGNHTSICELLIKAGAIE
jgi:ankyrin repeat protein